MDTSLMFMFVLYYYPHVIVYVSATIMEKCDVIIKFYVINICSWENTHSEMTEEEKSPVM